MENRKLLRFKRLLDYTDSLLKPLYEFKILNSDFALDACNDTGIIFFSFLNRCCEFSS